MRSAPGPRFGSPFDGYTRTLQAMFDKETSMMDRNASSRMEHAAQDAQGAGGVARCDAVPSRADPEAATDLPADDPGADEHLHATAEYPWFIPLWTGRAATTDPSADGPAVNGAGPTAATDLPAADSTAAAILPADDPGGHEHLLAAVQHPPLLRQGGP